MDQINQPARRLGGAALVLGILVFIAGGIAALFWARGRAMDRPTPAVVVLPFRNDSPDSQYFSDGLTIELIDALSKVEKLRVVSWNSAVPFRGKARDLHELRDRLQAAAVLDASLEKQGDRLRIAAQLIDTTSGEKIWSDTYDRPAIAIFQTQEEIAKSIVYTLKVPLRMDPQRILVPPRTSSITAYEDYLRARSFRSQLDIQKSSEYAEKAIAEDGKYSPAYALLASNYGLYGSFMPIPASESASRAKDFARKAIAMDSTSGEAHAALGAALVIADWDWKAARLELERGVQWSPGSPETHAAFAYFDLAPMGQFDSAEYEARKALELDPLSFFANYAAGYVLLAQAKHNEALDRFSTALTQHQGFAAAHANYGLALIAAGRKDEGNAELAKSCELKNCSGPMAQAWLAAGQSDLNTAFIALNQAIDQRDPRALFIQSDTRFTSLRNDPRYNGILKQLRLRE